MHGPRWSRWGGLLLMGLIAAVAGAQSTSGTSPTSTSPSNASSSTSTTPPHRHHHHKAQTQVSAQGAATTGSAGPTETPAHRSADQRLLKQQQTQSVHAATVNDQVVQQSVDQQQKAQNEVRIQDAPGPSQTGVVPAAGVPAAPVNANDRIQDAPGPAQTLAPLPATVPASTASPDTSPASAPNTVQPSTNGAPAESNPPASTQTGTQTTQPQPQQAAPQG